MRAIWKGAISFSLVNIPVSLYPATRRNELKFHLLRQSDSSPINYRRVAETDNQEVPWEQIVKGFEYEKGKFVVLDDKDFERADLKATQSIELLEFVPMGEIDPMFFDRPYYLEPQKPAVKAYALLREALRRTGRVGIAKVVIKTRQHLAALRPDQNALTLELMHFAQELVGTDTLQIPSEVQLGKRELEMAVELIERMSGHWQPDKYTDEYRNALMALIEEKVKLGGRTPAGAPAPKQAPTHVIDLVSVLEQSLKGAAQPAPAKTKSARKPKKPLRKAA